MKRLPRWQEQRKALLQSACNYVAEQRQQGIPVLQAINAAAAKFHNRALGEGHRLQLSEKSCQRAWYTWVRSGGSASVFNLKYQGPKPTTDPLLLRMVVEYCLETGSSLEEAIKAVSPPGAKLTIAKLARSFPKNVLDTLARSQKRSC